MHQENKSNENISTIVLDLFQILARFALGKMSLLLFSAHTHTHTHTHIGRGVLFEFIASIKRLSRKNLLEFEDEIINTLLLLFHNPK